MIANYAFDAECLPTIVKVAVGCPPEASPATDEPEMRVVSVASSHPTCERPFWISPERPNPCEISSNAWARRALVTPVRILEVGLDNVAGPNGCGSRRRIGEQTKSRERTQFPAAVSAERNPAKRSQFPRDSRVTTPVLETLSDDNCFLRNEANCPAAGRHRHHFDDARIRRPPTGLLHALADLGSSETCQSGR